MNVTDTEIRELLRTYRKIAVVGISPDPARPSHGVSNYLIRSGFDLVGVRPGEKEVLGRPCYPSLTEIPAPMEIVDVFRASDAVPGLVDEIERLPAERRPKVLWLQEGVQHAEAEERAARLGLKVVSDRCILKEHRRL